MKRDYRISITYQAVFKSLQELIKEGVLKKQEMNYEINLAWINYLHDITEKIKSKYLMKKKLFTKSIEITRVVYNFDPRMMKFEEGIGRRAEDYLRGSKGCILVLKGNTLFGLVLKNYLENRGFDITFEEIDRQEPKLFKDNVENRKVIIVDGAIYTGGSYKRVMDKLHSVQKKYNIQDIKYAVEYDMAGLADWNCEDSDINGVNNSKIMNKV